MNLLNKGKIATVFFGGFLCGAAYLVSCGKVNTNEASATGAGSALIVKANGTTVGNFVAFTNPLEEGPAAQQSAKVVLFKSSTSFLGMINRDGVLSRAYVHYGDALCSGQGYAEFAWPGFVFLNGSSIFHVARAVTPTTQSGLDWSKDWVSGACISRGVGASTPIVAVTANDPAVTGVSQTSFTPPITVE